MNNITEPATAKYCRIEDTQTWNGGGVVKPESWWLSAAVQTGLINVHADDGVAPKTVDLDAWQVDLLQKIVKQEAWDAYASLGYKRSWKELGLG